MPKRFLRLLALLFAFGLVLAACGGDDGGGESTTTTNADDEEEENEDEDEDAEDEDEEAEDEEGDDRDDAIGDFGDQIEDDLGDVPTDTETDAEYVTVSDDSGLLRVDVPADWSDVNGAPGLFGPDIIASTDVQAWLETWGVPGLEFQATGLETNQSTDEILTAVSRLQANSCTSLGRQAYADPLYVGVSEVFEDCGGTETDFVWVAFEPADQSYHGVFGVQILSEADVDALERALDTFVVDV